MRAEVGRPAQKLHNRNAFPPMPLDFFSNASATIERPTGNRTAKGFEETGTEEVLSCRGDYQGSGRSLERAQQVYETGDGLFFANLDVAEVEPGDEITIRHDDGRVLDGSVDEVIGLDNKILLSL